MLAEALTAMLLLITPPLQTPAWMLWTNCSLVVLLWGSTFLWQVPKHERLSVAFDAAVHQQLVQSNWLRTGLWTAKGLVAIAMLVSVMAP